MNVSEKLRLGNPVNVALAPASGWMSKQDESFTIRELLCEKCKQVLAVEVTEHPADVALVWPHKTLCTEQGHVLVPRKMNQAGVLEGAGSVLHSRGATLDEANAYLENYR